MDMTGMHYASRFFARKAGEKGRQEGIRTHHWLKSPKEKTKNRQIKQESRRTLQNTKLLCMIINTTNY